MCVCLYLCAQQSRSKYFTISCKHQSQLIICCWILCPGAMNESWRWSRSFFQAHVQAGNREAWPAVVKVSFVEHRWTGNGLGQSKGVGRRDYMSILGKYPIILIDQPHRVSTTKALPAEYLVPGAPRTSTKIKKLLMSIEKSERDRGNRAMDGSKREKNGRIKEILILSERVLIFFLWVGHVHTACY